MFSFATVSCPSYSPASSSRIGATTRHGPHHGAQKSTTTGVSDFNTFCSKSASVTVIGLAMIMDSFYVSTREPRVSTTLIPGGVSLLYSYCAVCQAILPLNTTYAILAVTAHSSLWSIVLRQCYERARLGVTVVPLRDSGASRSYATIRRESLWISPPGSTANFRPAPTVLSG